jgi:hypothetical protein
MKTTVQRRIALLAGLFVVALLVFGVSAQAALASGMGGSVGGATAAQVASAGSAAPSSVGDKVPQTQLQTRRLLDAWAGQGRLGIVPVAPGVRGPGVPASSGPLSGGTDIALIMGTAAIAALSIGSIAAMAVAGSERRQQQEPACVGEGC